MVIIVDMSCVVWQVSACLWEADDLLYWVESRQLQLRSTKLPSCELQAVHAELDAFTVSSFLCPSSNGLEL